MAGSSLLSSAPSSLVLSSVSKAFNGAPAVSDISLQLNPGEFLTMLGPSGSGKTTTLNLIAGFIQPDTGSITLDDRDVTTIPSHKRGIGVVFQNYALFPHMSALQNVAFPLEMRGVRRKAALTQAHDALELVQLAHLAGRLPRQLSGGQQQRVALARSFVFKPGLLLMDEPLGALDKRLREDMQLEIMRLGRELGCTIVSVTHDQEEALVMSDRIAIYHDGRIEQLGTAEDLYEHPRNMFVANFMGEANQLDGDVANSVFTTDGWTSRVPDSAPKGRVTLLVRPENTIAVAAEAAEDSDGIDGVVIESIYLGGTRKFVIRLDNGRRFQAIASARTGPALAAGDRARMSWRAEHAIVLASEDSPTVPADAA